MPGSGFCLYHSLSYCLTGNDKQYVAIIDDCLSVFQNIPELFRLRTNFGSYNNSSLSLEDYASCMRHAVQLVQVGCSADSHAYGDEGHVAAIALLYDITVFTYSVQNKTWYVLNESGRCGYICLLHLPDHFDVLHGTNGAPAIPRGVHTQGVNRHSFDTSLDGWQSLQRNYSFQNVFRFPEHYSGVEILNNPVIAYAETSTGTSSNVADDDFGKSLYACQYEQCTFVGKNAQSLHLHKLRRHKVKNVSNPRNSVQRCSHGSQLMQPLGTTGDCNIVETGSGGPGHSELIDSECVETRAATQYMCGFEQCGFIAKNAKALYLHKNVRHRLRQTAKAAESHQDTSQLQAIETDDNDVEVVTHAKAGSSCERTIPGNGIDETMYVCNAKSLVSTENTCSRRSERIAKKRTASITDNRSGCYTDRNDKTLLHDTLRLTSQFRREKTVRSCVNMDVEPDNASVNTVVSTDSGLRRSVRISNRKRKYNESQTDIIDNRKSTTMKAVNIRNRNVRKGDIKKSFSQVISERERDFIPQNVSLQNDPLYDKLKAYHDDLLKSVSNTTTEKISAEVVDVIENVSLLDSHDRRYQWSLSDQDRLNELNRSCKLLQPRTQWTWGAPDDSEQGQYNDQRMQLCVTQECQWKLIECNSCDSTGLLVGDQIDSELCYDCVKLCLSLIHI